MTLNNRQRVTVNAGLAYIHAAGYDANAISRAARAHIAQGLPAAAAYGRSIDRFKASLPTETRVAMDKVMRLVHSSDAQTIAQYDHAINSYNATGDEAAIEALYPMMARDGVTLALRDGEITQAEIDDGTGIAAALGYEPMPEQVAAVQSAAPQAAPLAPPAPVAILARDHPPAAPVENAGIVRDETGVSYSSARLATVAPRAPLSGIIRDQTGVSYSSARSDAKSAQFAGQAPRPWSFKPIVRHQVEPGEGPTLEKSGYSAV